MGIRKEMIIMLWLAILFLSCTRTDTSKNKPIKVDFKVRPSGSAARAVYEENKPLNIAISAMISPKEAYIYYQDLITYLSKKIERPIQFKQRKTYQEVNDLLENGQIDIGFICSGAYVKALQEFPLEIIAVPVVNSQPYYQAYVIVNKASSIQKFSQLKGKSFAFTDPLSNTGYNYVVQRLKQFNQTVDQFFAKTMFTYAHDYSIQAVAHNIADGACIDGLIYNYLKKYNPEKVTDITIIEMSENFGIPPIVASPKLAPTMKSSIRNILFQMHYDSVGTEILDHLLIDRFTSGDSTDYSTIYIN